MTKDIIGLRRIHAAIRHIGRWWRNLLRHAAVCVLDFIQSRTDLFERLISGSRRRQRSETSEKLGEAFGTSFRGRTQGYSFILA